MKTKAEQSVQNYVYLNNHTYIFYVWLLSVHKNLMYGLKFLYAFYLRTMFVATCRVRPYRFSSKVENDCSLG